MVRKIGNLTISEYLANLDMDNGRIRVRLYIRDGGYVQEFHAKDRTGKYRPVLSSLHKNLIPASDHRVGASPMISGERPHLFGVCRESLRMVYSQATITEHTEHAATVRLSGNVQGHALNCDVRLLADTQHVHISVDDNITSEDDAPLVEYLMSAYAFLPGEWAITNGRPLDYAWAPMLRPKRDHVIGDRAFGTPALIVQHDAFAATLVPDLRALSTDRPMPAALDLDIANGLLFAPLLSYGFCGYERTDDGNFCRHDVTMSRRLNPPRLSYAYYLLVSADSKRRSAYRDVSSFLWTTYGSSAIRQPSRPFHLTSRPSEGLMRVASDTHTGLCPQTGWDVLKPAQDALALYESTGTRKHLENGLKALDQACLGQNVWRLSWNEETEPGLCVSSNVGGQPDPVLTAEFALCAMRYGAITGERCYFERGTAALMAALNVQGLDPRTQAAIGLCADSIRAEFGSAYIHVGKKWGACAADTRLRRLEFGQTEIALDFVPHPGPNGHRRVVFGGLRASTYTISIDGRRQTCTRDQLQSGLPLP